MVDSSTLTVQPRKNYSFSLKPELTGKAITLSTANAQNLINKAVKRMRESNSICNVKPFFPFREVVLKSGYIGEFAGFEQWKPDFTNWLEF